LLGLRLLPNIDKVNPPNTIIEIIMDIELVAIQIIIFGVIILVYMAQEFDK